jgi:hypothetical protein
MEAVNVHHAWLFHRSVRLSDFTESRTTTDLGFEPTSTHAPVGMLKLDLRQAIASAAIDMPITPC